MQMSKNIRLAKIMIIKKFMLLKNDKHAEMKMTYQKKIRMLRMQNMMKTMKITKLMNTMKAYER